MRGAGEDSVLVEQDPSVFKIHYLSLIVVFGMTASDRPIHAEMVD